MLYRHVAKPFFFKMDPEKAHHLVIDGLEKAGSAPGGKAALRLMYGVPESPELAVDLFGLHFPSPVGLAAGLDKNAQAVEGFSNIGFGFMEVGTVTPRPQPGNDLPRLFRLPEHEALINRMGFNNEGAEAMAARLKKAQRRIPVAVNIGRNKTTANEAAHDDYRECIRTLYPYGDFFVVNISSPNTPGLRSLQHGDELAALLAGVREEMKLQQAGSGQKKSLLVKIAPDLTAGELEGIVHTLTAAGVDGVIATNTTVSRDGLNHRHAGETGGLSGRPLTARSTQIVSAIYRQTGGKLPIIGSGGIFTARDAYDKIRAGASLVEIYTALIYEGPEVNRRLHAGLRNLLRRDGFDHISEAVGADHRK